MSIKPWKLELTEAYSCMRNGAMDGPNTGFKTMPARNKFSFEAVSSGNCSESSFLALVTSKNSCGVCLFHTVFVYNVLSGPALMPSL